MKKRIANFWLRDFLRWFVRVLIHIPQLDGPLTRVALAFRIAESNRYAHFSAKKLGFEAMDTKSLSFFPLAEEREKLFILGKGPTRAEIIKRHGKEIALHYSIGINDYSYEDFEPNAESREEPFPGSVQFEHWPVSPPGGQLMAGSSIPGLTAGEWRQNTWILQKVSVAERRNGFLRPVSEARRGLVRIYSAISFMANDSKKVGRNFGIVMEKLKNGRKLAVLVGSESSVVRMVCLGLLGGFQKIVLVGVDLQGVTSAVGNPSGGERHWIHQTASKQGPNHIPVQEILRSIAGEVDYAEIFVGHGDSLLAEFLPVYPWARDDGQ